MHFVVDVRDPDSQRHHAFEVRDGTIVDVVEGPPEEVDQWLTRPCGAGVRVVRVEGYAHPAFIDTHNHLVLAARNQSGVPMRGATALADIVQGVQHRASRRPAGDWIVTAADWHETQLAEKRLPTASELDAATREHPVLVLRGGHNGVANSAALERAGIGVATPDVVGGLIERDGTGRPTGLLQDEALSAVQRLIPPLPEDDVVAGLDTVSLEYLRTGVGVVRDPAVSVEDWAALQRAHSEGRLHVRTHAMLFTPAGVIEAAGSMEEHLSALEAAGLSAGQGDDFLRLWGIKLILDGGVEAAAMSEPYHSRPDFRGTLLMDHPALLAALRSCVERGWPVGVHAMGDAAIEAFLDAVEHNVAAGVRHPRGAVVLEHGGLITAGQTARATALDIHITAQQALRDGLAGPMVSEWGTSRVAKIFPWSQLLSAGAWVSAGTDHPIGPLNPLDGIVGMTTRETPLGTLGPEFAVPRRTALDLYTRSGAGFLGAPLTGRLTIGSPADIAVYPVDPSTAADIDLVGQTPVLVVLDGHLHQF